MSFTLSPRSLRALDGVHPDLVRIVKRAAALSTLPFIVTEGRRTLARQRTLVASGASRTLNSRHLHGHAVDLAPVVSGAVRWDWPLFHKLAAVMDAAAAELGLPLEWGGRWKTWKDGPHFQLPHHLYP